MRDVPSQGTSNQWWRQSPLGADKTTDSLLTMRRVGSAWFSSKNDKADLSGDWHHLACDVKWSKASQKNPCLTSAWRVVYKAISRWSHHLLLNNELTGGDQRHRGEENQSSIHLTGEIRWFVLALWENPANMCLKVLSRHLHPMAYPGHRAGVTAGSSTQPGESDQLLTPRNALNHYGEKQRRSNRCHTRMHRVQNSDCCWKTHPWSLSVYNN